MKNEGFLIIDKPQGWTSHDVVGRIRRIAQLKRVGHAGTLDPLATGVLVVALGRATRLLEYVVGQDKQYHATIRLGQETDSYDAEGEIVAHRPITCTPHDIAEAVAHFQGEQQQLPPMYSAIKKNGQPLYHLARQGIIIEREPRIVQLTCTLLDWQLPDLQLRVTCSSGTYIRSLAHDLGQMLGCGGHLVGLRRERVGRFTLDQAIPLDTLSAENIKQNLLPSDIAIWDWPRHQLTDLELQEVRYGRPITQQSSAEWIALYHDEQFYGLAQANNEGFWRMHKLFFD